MLKLRRVKPQGTKTPKHLSLSLPPQSNTTNVVHRISTIEAYLHNGMPPRAPPRNPLCGNPLLLDFLEEWYQESVGTGSKAEQMYVEL